ncbi:hypothetical protein DEM34_11535 [Spiribacter halobius]|uniref:Uncharacterized protein n=1 Tax=Sediminicurvatus halobius TaxID=2182432 RepID=A0A2U2N062_9GAMM|nr:hypothetical protein DEM34_11535 [Spiribacter halobius]
MASSVLLAGTTAALAHGEAEPGPHGGEIRMPGAFHTEVVAASGALRVYLLDMQFENPQTAESSVEVTVRQQGETHRVECTAAERAFRCPLPDGVSLNAGALEVSAVRGGGQSWDAEYSLPLAFSGG